MNKADKFIIVLILIIFCASISQVSAINVDGNGTYNISQSDINQINSTDSIDEIILENSNNEILENSYPTVNYHGGYYNQSNLTLELNINNANSITYSWDNTTWLESNHSLSFILPNGIYDLYYHSDELISHEHYVIDCVAPSLSSNYQSDLYYTSILVNLSATDNLDSNPKIYYTIDGSDPLENGILFEDLINVSRTTSLKFYAEDFGGLKSPVVCRNYIFARVGNINSGKGFRTIQSAIDDNDTVNGDVIYVGPGIFYGPIYLTKSVSLIGRGSPTITVKDNYPTINYPGGYYNQSNLTIELTILEDEYIWYSWDNNHWIQSFDSLNFTLRNGVYDLYYEYGSGITHQHYLIDNKAPLVWCNYYSDLYSDSISVNLSCWDNLDNDSKIYYTIDGSNPLTNGILYSNPINVSSTTCLKFYAEDFAGLKSDVITCNYIFDNVANINSGKGFNTIQSAISDADTHDGDTIKVKEGLYQEHITVNKYLNLIGYNATLKGSSSSNPVIGITNPGSNSLVYGFKIVNSTFGVVVLNASNVSIIGNTFLNLYSSIETDGDVNSLIAYNTIDCDHYIGGMSGCTIRKSDNLTMFNNTIFLNSNDNSAGVIITDATSDNISITNNKLSSKNSLKGFGLYVTCSNIHIEENTISNFSAALFIVSSNSLIYNNYLNDNGCGAYLLVSINNTYKSNNIFNNIYGVYLHPSLSSSGDSFYLNRLCDNLYYDFCSQATCPYVIDDNWWGDNTPMISTDQHVLANVFNSTGNLIMNSWIVMNLFSASYTIDDNSFVQRAQFYLDMTYNNLGHDLSYEGYLPDGLETLIYCFNNNANYKYNLSYLKQGKAFVDFQLSDLFSSWNNIYVVSHFDYGNITRTFNKKATIDITLFSSAEDVDSECFVNYTASLDFVNDTSWITVSWTETGLYSGVINLIVDGEIIESFNITNLFYQTFKDDYRSEVFEAIKFFNNVFASMKQGVWQPNYYYLSFAEMANIDYTDYELVYYTFLNYLRLFYNLTDSEISFVNSHKNLFIDIVEIVVDFHGDVTPDINFDFEGEHKVLSTPSSYAHRISNIYYTNIEDENNVSIGYEGMRSFAVVKGNVSDDILRYWLNQKENYEPGLMKAAYGTFLTSLLVIYENDRVADEAAEKYNVTWSRISPVCVSLCNDYNCLYITGESDHGMGREATGNDSGVWKFNFATSFSFSLVEQLVGNNVWNTTVIGSVTLGLIETYINNGTLEIFTSNGYTFIKREGDNSTLLFLDLETGIVRDIFSYYGLLGTMPCYHDNITENAWNYGNNTLDKSSDDFKDLLNITNFSINMGIIIGLVSGESLVIGEGAGLVITGTGIGIFGIALVPIAFELLRPDIANLFEIYGLYDLSEYYYNNNVLDMLFDTLYYKFFGENSKIPLEQRMVLFSYFTFNFLNHPEFISFSIANPNSDLNKLINFVTSFSKKHYDYTRQPNLNDVYSKIKNTPSPDPKSPWEMLAEHVRDSAQDLIECIKNGDVKGFFHNSIVITFGAFCVLAYVVNSLGDEISEAFIEIYEKIIMDYLP
ncbi:chitobiase/beta-hexosaminidase C-terminal domain-containing protein [Methanobrevibacter sp.]|uniref:chitobiase/beta-hexosaminidase C-terminal domain-containing protein n=1 Tax=Methanobrevibacter sp. TaxID=66852 RepID=UPI0025F37C9B|nr:chitobiase/beta-hexosaminidase C-terminal domain-containing protein [Methanobrevibacter sp.]MBR4448187.1 chitobiase/beta-hexosaminidase C-terminal domain-containing protein [Methanobrevibacter sp.]